MKLLNHLLHRMSGILHQFFLLVQIEKSRHLLLGISFDIAKPKGRHSFISIQHS